MDSSVNHNNLISAVTVGAVGIAAASLAALTFLQSDVCSRTVLSADALAQKRRSEYNYRWTQALEKAKLQFQYFLSNGDVSQTSEEEALLRTTLVTTEEEMRLTVDKILSKDNPSSFRVARIGKDKTISSTEFFLWLYCTKTGQVVQLPLTTFAALLAKALERHISRTTFCFVSDASANAASRTLVGLVRATKTSVHVLEEPLWMVALAAILEQNLLADTTAESVLFALCRLEAQRCKDSTFLITLPGQAATTLLLPLLQKVFPDDRHVFSYTGCVRTMQYVAQQRQLYQRAKIPTNIDEALRFDNPVAVTTPIHQTLYRSTNVMKPFRQSLARLPIGSADIVETWMGAVDAFLLLKDDEKINGYLPYVFKLDYVQNTSFEKGKDGYWIVLSLLQFVTGSRSRSRDLTEQQIDAAIAWLKDHVPPTRPTITHKTNVKLIEETVFNHKRILLENKTLLDTVQPKEHWTLKQAIKGGCACCAPEEDDDPEDMGALTQKLAAFRGITPKPINGGYVDGKTSFAFDPTRFNL